MTVETAVRRIEAWLAQSAPGLAAALRAPAGEDELSALEVTLRRPIPPDLAAWLRRHNGQEPNQFAVFGDYSPLGAREIAAEWKTSCEFPAEWEPPGSPAVRSGWYRDGWIPFASTGGGDLLVVDTEPGPDGRVGQVLDWRHDHHARPVVAPDLSTWLAGLADELEAGLWSVDPVGFLLGPE
ncbi:MAG: SMI1/KNR4 family protein [Deltaproteobacteria bacterium]|nr:SMI1/KNR4 family protein [Deltaproteobacteria bacterium]